jgi:uncharacterized damage-inducible protein DinB
MDLQHFRRFARYNRWANQRLYGACGSLTDSEYFAPRAGFFPSLHKTLNHILVGDRTWLGRIEGVPAGIQSLDQVLYDDLASLQTAREAEDARIVALTDGMSEARLGGDLSYRSMAGDPFVTPMTAVLTHFFNHQTHHRGQAHAMLSGTTVSPPSLDLILFLREAP